MLNDDLYGRFKFKAFMGADGIILDRIIGHFPVEQVDIVEQQVLMEIDELFLEGAVKADQRRKLEGTCRYIARPAISVERLSLTEQGHVRHTLKTPCADGTTHVVLEPLDCMARLAALVPKPRVNLTRYHGVFAPNSPLRQQLTPAQRGQQDKVSNLDLSA